MKAKINKRERKRLEARKAKLVRSLEIHATAFALTGGLSDSEFFDRHLAKRAELEAILTRLGEPPMHIGQSHHIIHLTDGQA